jgi:hypothetical protein
MHPWSISGGGAADLKETLETESTSSLGGEVASIGFMVIAGCDEVVVGPERLFRRSKLPHRDLITGEQIRDWGIKGDESVLFVYDDSLPSLPSIPEGINREFDKFLWPNRTVLRNRSMFGKTPEEHGFRWYEYIQFIRARVSSNLFIAYAAVSTHNQFVMGRGGKVYNRHAPIITMAGDATEEDYIALLGLLNSSTACFWMKQALHDKGGGGIGGGLATEFWEHFFEFAVTGLERFPLPESRSLTLSCQLDDRSRQYESRLPESTARTGTPTSERITRSRNEAASIRGKMIALQEELDWHCYLLYGLLKDRSVWLKEDSEIPVINLGERAFEIVMAQQTAKGEPETTWFERHGSTPTAEVPTHWPAAYRELVERRIKVIEMNKEIALIEKPEYKRRWNDEPWEEQEQRALKNWLLDRLETPKYRKVTKDNPELTTTAQMADVASADAEFLQVAALYRGRPDFDVAALVAELVESESVPFLPILRYKPSGLRKRALWEHTWEMQREEDRTTKHTKHTKGEEPHQEPDSLSRELRGSSQSHEVPTANEDIENQDPDSSFRVFRGSIPVPPKYTSADLLKTDFWRLRGKLDVPKERWISYPHCSTDSDPTLVLGWAGWNHLEQATALVAYYDARKREGWTAERLKPLLAGLDQLIPWIHQWHPEIDPEYRETAGHSFQHMLESDAHELGLTLEEIRNWEPPAKGGRRKAESAKRKKRKPEDGA